MIILGLWRSVAGVVHAVERPPVGEPERRLADFRVSEKPEFRTELASPTLTVDVVVFYPTIEESQSSLIQTEVDKRNHNVGLHNQSRPQMTTGVQGRNRVDVREGEICGKAGTCKPVPVVTYSDSGGRGGAAILPRKGELDFIENPRRLEVKCRRVLVRNVSPQLQAGSLARLPKGRDYQDGPEKAKPDASERIIGRITSRIRSLPLGAKIASALILLIAAPHILLRGYLDIADLQYRARGVRNFLSGLALIGLSAGFWWLASPN